MHGVGGVLVLGHDSLTTPTAATSSHLENYNIRIREANPQNGS